MRDRLAHLLGNPVMLLADDGRIEQDRRRAQRIDGGIHALGGHRSRQHDHAVEVARNGGHRRIGEIVGRHVDGFDRGHRHAGDRGDALMQRGDFGGERRLVADARRQAPEQAGDFAARLHEPKHIVHQQQHVLPLLVAEILRDRQRGQPDAPARSRRLVHLAVDEHAAVEHAGSPHFGEQLVAFTRALADAGKDGNALVAFAPWHGSVP